MSGWLVLLTLTLSLTTARAFIGATVPWTTYEAEAATTTGTVLGPHYVPTVAETEASGRSCVQLTTVGQYLEFTNRSFANAIVVRYSVPDTADGVGTNYTISFYTNGAFAGKLALTSKYSWLYGNYPFSNTPSAGTPRNFFDEVRTNGLSIQPGDRVRLQKDGSDTATNYLIDFVDLEDVAAPLTAPANSLSVTNYSAVGNGVADCTTAFQNCINAAQSQGKKVWIPPGAFLISGNLNLPPNTTIQGAGMWHAKLVGSTTLYADPARRINLNGNGSNIHLSDFAILGRLNYRNDSEGNDGLGGSYGTGSTLARLWVEHTKAAAWLYNSSGLLVDGCRFRNTLADGINLNSGMLNTIVTNCTARGTGDDCFAMWPAAAGTYPAANNVITHCTGQFPFLANGGALYGGASNRIEDCLFQDIPYGCGILFSTTFPVADTFSGTTVAQRCNLVCAGGYDPFWGWRGALQLVLNTSGISGVNLNNLNILNSVSDGLSILGGSGALSNAVASFINVPNYGLGTDGRNALWARADAVGSLAVSNSALANYQNDSARFSLSILAPIGTAVRLVFTTPPGLAVAGLPFPQQPVLKTVDAGGNPTLLGLPASLPVYLSLTNGAGTLLGTTNCDLGSSANNGVATFTDLRVDNVATNLQLMATVASAGVGGPPAGMSIWLDASVTSSVLTNAGGTVTNWLDLSGQGNNFDRTIGSGGRGIRYTNSAAPGRKTVTFNATSGSTGTELKNTTCTNASNAGSVFVVAKKSKPGIGEGAYQAVLATWAGNAANADFENPGSYTLNYNGANTTPRIFRSYVCDNNCPALDPATNFIVFEYIANGTAEAGNNSFWNGLAGGTTTGSQNGNADAAYNFNIQATSVGGGLYRDGNSINNPFAGDIAEVLVYNSSLNTPSRLAVENYLRSKWVAPFAASSAPSAAFNVQPNYVSVTVQPNPPGLPLAVDGTNYSSGQIFSWLSGSTHTIATTSPQSGGTGIRYVWSSWSDGAGILHSVNPTVTTNYTANFATQFYLTTAAGAGGSVSPSGLWTNSGAVLNLLATASNSYVFGSWTGSGSGSYSGTNRAASVTLNAPVTETASFLPLAESMQFLQQPANVLSGATIAPEVQVQAFDINGQPLTNTALVVSLASGTGTLAGSLSRATDGGGIAHFNDLSLNQAGPKMLSVAPASGSIAPTNSLPFTVIGSALALAFTTPPAGAVVGFPFAQQPILKTVDAFGTPSTSGLPATLQVSVGLTNGAGRLSGTTNYNIGTGGGNGVVSFTDLVVDTPGTNLQLVATTGAASFGTPLAGMSVWLDGSIPSSVLTNAGGIVTNWLDQSGNGNNFNTTIGSGGSGIRYTNTVVPGRKAVTFGATGGTGTELKNTTYTNKSKTASVFVVAKKTSPGTAEGGYQHVFATWAGGANPDYADSGSYSLDYNQNNNTPRIIRSGGAVDNNCPVMDPSTNYHAFEYIADGLGSNGVWTAMSGTTTRGAGPNFGTVNANFNIIASTVGGGMVNGTTVNNPFAGSIAEVLVYNSALSASNRLAVESYLRSKWIAPYGLTRTLSAAFNVSLPTPPSQKITVISACASNGVALTYATTAGFAYRVEMTTNLAVASWVTVPGSATNASGDFVTFTDTNRLSSQPRFYRTVSP